MSGWQFSFPQSRSCLWDGNPVGESTELFVTRNGWLRVQFSVPSLQLAVRHARQSTRKPYSCFLIATAWITKDESVLIEVDRFDPGRLPQGKENILPTVLMPGDVPIPCQVVAGSHPLAKHLTHNLVTLGDAFESLEEHLSCHPCPLDPALLLSLRVHLSSTSDGTLTVRCGCVSPAVVCEATPIRPIPIVQTALARNLSGPLPLSSLQGQIKHGYVTLDATRKIILLLHSDPKATRLPLVGVWVNGVGSVYHPHVWTACVSYSNTTSLSDRVSGEGSGGGSDYLLLVYVQGITQPSYWQCSTKVGRDGMMGQRKVPFEIASGDTSIQPSSDTDLVLVELFPAQESTALKTLLEATIKSSKTNELEGGVSSVNEMSCDLPAPSPKPVPTLVPQRPVRDSELSMLSSLSLADGSLVNQSRHSSIASGSHSSPVGPPLSSGQAQLKTTPTFTTTNTNTTCGPPSTHKHQSGLLHEEKENVFPFPRSPAKAGSPATADPHLSEEESLVVFPEKQFVDVKSSLRTDVPSPSTQEFLRQQEMQLRVLQEQVNSLLRSQSANSSPQVQGQRLTPKAEAGTNTGQSLFWHPHATPTTPPTSSQSQHRHSIPPTQVGSEYDEKTSVCSSAMADLSMQTATSILSQGVSEMHLDLQSYANSPNLSNSQSFGDSVSTADYRAEGGSDHESSPASLLFKDQQQFYKNMLAQVNDLIQSQQRQSSTSSSSTDSQSRSDSTTPECSPELQRCSHPDGRHVEGVADPTENGSYSSRGQQSRYKSVTDEAVQDVSTHREENEPPHNFNLEPVSFDPPLPPLDHSLPPLHPDILQQKFIGDISMLPVPRIMYEGGRGTGGITFMNQVGGAEFTMDENVQMADMIALKYLGRKNELTLTATGYDIPGGEGLVSSGGGGLGSDRTLAHMSMATRQYLEKHHLIRTSSTARGEEGVSSRSGEHRESRSDTERILDVQRLKTLPKLI